MQVATGQESESGCSELVALILVRSAHGRDRLVRRVAGKQRLGLPPVGVTVGHHDVKAPVTAFFFRFDKVESAEIEKVAFDEANFFFRHTATLEVHGNASQM